MWQACLAQNGRLAAKALLEQCAVFGDRFCFAQGEGAAELLRGRSGSVQGVLSDSGLRLELAHRNIVFFDWPRSSRWRAAFGAATSELQRSECLELYPETHLLLF